MRMGRKRATIRKRGEGVRWEEIRGESAVGDQGMKFKNVVFPLKAAESHFFPFPSCLNGT